MSWGAIMTEPGQYTGQTINGYHIQHRLGVGGMGEVYLAIKPAPEPGAPELNYAIKFVINKQPMLLTGVVPKPTPDQLDRFRREARLIASVKHPHIVSLVDYGVHEVDQVPYMVMDYLDGGTLADRIDGSLLPLESIMGWLTQIIGALAYAHERRQETLVHRDIKPSNILLDHDGNAYLSDFGIAQLLTDSGQTTSIMFSPQYAAPEQVSKPTATTAVDLFSLGMVAWELLSGKGTEPRDPSTKLEVLSLPSIANYRTDLNASQVDAVLAKATAHDPAARYAHVGDFQEALRAALFGLEGAATYRAEIPWRGENPYMGLAAFDETEAANFFGREALTEALVAHVGQSGLAGRMLALVGPSGSGKSSLLQAGLIHRLKAGALPGSDGWVYKQMNGYSNDLLRLLDVELTRDTQYPPGMFQSTLEGQDGLLSTVDRLLPRDKAVQMVLVLDQFEEVFTQVTDAEVRRHFLDLLTRAVTSPHARLRLVIGLRADFYDGPMQHGDFGRLVDAYNVSVLPMSQDELRAAIVEPARKVGLRFESALEETILADAEGQAGALPLLQYLLSQMVQQDTVVGSTLRRQTYTDLGGVARALGNQADALYDKLTDEQQQAIRQVFLRLVTVGEEDGGRDTRRRANMSEVNATLPQADYVVELFARERLLTLDRRKGATEPTVEVAHEALIQTWGRLRGWLDSARRDLPLSRELTALTARWVNAQRGPDSLTLFGERLLEMEQFAVQTDIQLTLSEREYVAACRQRVEAAEAERKGMLADLKAQQAQSEASARAAEAASARAQRNRRLALGTIVMAVVLGLIMVPALLTALNERATAEADAQVAISQATDAFEQGSTQVAQSAGTVAVLNETLTPVPGILTAAADQVGAANDSVATLDARAASANRAVDSLNQTLSPLSATLTPVPLTLTAAADQISEGNRAIATATAQIATINEELRSSETIRDARTRPLIQAIPMALDSLQRASASIDAQALVFELLNISPAIVRTLNIARPTDADPAIQGTVFSPDGNRLYVNTLSTFQVYELATDAWLEGDPVAIYSYPNEPFDFQFMNAFTVSPDSSTILAGFADGSLKVLNSQSMLPITSWDGHEDVVTSVSISRDGTRYLTASEDGTVAVWDAATQALLYRFTGHDSPVTFAAFTPDASAVVSRSGGDADSNVRATISFWDSMTGEEKWDRIVLDRPGDAADIAFSPDGNHIFYGVDNLLSLIDSATGRAAQGWPIELPGGTTSAVIAATFSPDSSQILLSILNGELQLRNLDGSEDFSRSDHQEAALVLAFHPNLPQFVSISLQSFNAPMEAFVWDTASSASAPRASTFVGFWSAQPFMPDGQSYFTFTFSEEGEEDGTAPGIAQIDSATNEVLRQFNYPDEILESEATVGELLITPDGEWLVTTYSNQSVVVFNLASGNAHYCPQRTTGDQSEYWPGIAISPDSTTVASESPFEDSTVILWDLTSPDCAIRQRLADTETRDLLLIASERVQGYTQFNNDWRRSNTMVFSPDGRYLYTGANFSLNLGETGLTNQLLRWDLETGAIFRFQTSGFLPTAAIALSPDGSKIARGAADGVTIWDASSGELLLDLSGIGHTTPIWDLQFSPDGTQIASVDRTGLGLIRDVNSGRQIAQFGSGEIFIASITYTPDGSYILGITRSGDVSTAYLWIADPAVAAEWLGANRYQALLPANLCALYNITPSRCEPAAGA
jgi:WD40 repeat protein/energy-coupling factor transporter ATP-binding protein EcfA2